MKHYYYEKDGTRKYYHIDEDANIVNDGYYYLRDTFYENMTEKEYEEMNLAISNGKYKLNNIIIDINSDYNRYCFTIIKKKTVKP